MRRGQRRCGVAARKQDAAGGLGRPGFLALPLQTGKLMGNPHALAVGAIECGLQLCLLGLEILGGGHADASPSANGAIRYEQLTQRGRLSWAGSRSLLRAVRGAAGIQLLIPLTYDKVQQLYFQNPTFGFYLLRLTTERLLQNLARLEARLAPRVGTRTRQDSLHHGAGGKVGAPDAFPVSMG
jgi:hypothetical protein